MPIAKLEAFEESSVRMAAFAKALSHPARICILRFLAGKREVPCMDIVAALPLSQPACSRHINELKRAGLLTARNEGNKVLFTMDQSALNHFCLMMNQTLHPADES
ncbi:MAG: ArsR/SmtB family transcription factor [Verrucomicrobiales bacterium]|nr:metalloregulator ArsR/SmtB family transcription factor [Verrucomicrobiota bacterium JB025]